MTAKIIQLSDAKQEAEKAKIQAQNAHNVGHLP